ncbi:MAG: hypothetical protein LBJ90_02565 [Treponema sp.]|nr:hypothetical protein [Treponema sp.]
MKLKHLFFLFLGSIALLCSPCSCSTSTETEDVVGRILGDSSEAPVFLTCKAVTGTEIDFQFSRPVRVISLYFDPAVEIESLEDGSVVRVVFSGGPAPGGKITADLLVEDEKGNTMNVLVPLRTRNVRMPGLRINELRTEYSKPKAEFIEFKTLEEGNLAALRLFIAGNSKNPMVYEFPSLEVAADEYILLHLRSMEETSRDETGDNLDESGGTDAVAGVRDLWRPGTEKVLHKTDVVYLLDQDDKVIDAVALAENSDPQWNKEYLAGAAEFLYSQRAWESEEKELPGPNAAVNTFNIKTAMTRSVSRDETAADSNTLADWYITATGGISPGKPNKPERF